MSQTATIAQAITRAQGAHVVRFNLWYPFWLLSVVTLLVSTGLLASVGKLNLMAYVTGSETLVGAVGSALAMILIYHAARIMIFERPKSLMRTYITKLGAFFEAPSSWLVPALNFLALANLLQNYTLLKKVMSSLKPFSWDSKLLAADKWLHFGVDPWRITHGLFASDIAAYVINFNYHVWFFVVFGFLVWGVLGRKNEQLRAQYLLSAMAVWVISGNLLAIYFSSAGPCFFHHLGQGNPLYFQPLMQRLDNSHASLLAHGLSLGLPAVPLQQTIWNDYITSGNMLGGGVSAFPSMHVAMAVSVALVASRLNRWLGFAAWLFALAIQIGSVHLGWHYAVDGYASTLVAILFWKLSGKIIKLTSPS